MRRPTYTTPDGARPETTLRFIDAGLKRRPPVGRLVRGIAGRLLWTRLPDLAAHYDDRVFLIPQNDPMYAAVFFDGAYEPHCSDFLRAWLRRGDHAIDIGANHGWYSLLMASAVGATGTVLACEPMPDMVSAWRRNLARNQHLDATLATTALGELPGVLELHHFAGLPHGHTSISDLGRSDFVRVCVEVRRLDDVLVDHAAPTFVKLDVEGSELAVLKGASGILGGPRPPTWLVEVNYTTAGALGYSPADLYSFVTQFHNYAVYRISENGLLPEPRVEDAPHASSWVFVSEHDRDRLTALTS